MFRKSSPYFQGSAFVEVSCVEEKMPFRSHPNNLVGKFCRNGVCKVPFNESDMAAVIKGVGIQCVKKNDVKFSLQQRQSMNVDPFAQGFESDHSSFNLNAVRLCFQVFLNVPHFGLVRLRPVVSDVIMDNKTYGDLKIVKCSHNFAPFQGGKKILIFCSKVNRNDIEVHFKYKKKCGNEDVLKGIMQPKDVHEQYGIRVLTPMFDDFNQESKVKAKMYLYKPSTNSQSRPIDFYFCPNSCTNQKMMERPTPSFSPELIHLNQIFQGNRPKSTDDQ